MSHLPNSPAPRYPENNQDVVNHPLELLVERPRRESIVVDVEVDLIRFGFNFPNSTYSPYLSGNKLLVRFGLKIHSKNDLALRH
jgi:hypothetical protein